MRELRRFWCASAVVFFVVLLGAATLQAQSATDASVDASVATDAGSTGDSGTPASPGTTSPGTTSIGTTLDAGITGFGSKHPVLASACPHGCPWGELGDFVREAMQPFGYDVVLCRNCNLDTGPRLVGNAGYPPELTGIDTFVGTTTRVNAPVDFGITASTFLFWAYQGLYNYDGEPYTNLRLIAKIEDPTYLLVAVKADSGITDLSQIAAQKLPVTILGGLSPISQPVLDYYGLTEEAVKSWGGVFENPIIVGQGDDPPFDIAITENGSSANNPESAYWTKISQKHDLRFLDIPQPVLTQLLNDKTLGVVSAVVKWGFLRGVDRPIPTVARSGHVVFARDDMPEQAAYDTARAIDEHRDALKWFIRPYSYDSRTVWQDFGVPLHPGAVRYYCDVGYITEGCPSEEATSAEGGCGCRTAASKTPPSLQSLALAIGAVLACARRRRKKRSVCALLRRIEQEMGDQEEIRGIF